MAEELKIQIDGMSCEHCKNTIEGEISKLDGVQKVEVSLSDKSAWIQFSEMGANIKQELSQLILQLGYEVKA